MRKYDLEQRLIDFAVGIIDISAGLENSKAGHHLGGQLLRSGTSPALNYLSGNVVPLTSIKKECNELIAICVKSIETAVKNMNLAASG